MPLPTNVRDTIEDKLRKGYAPSYIEVVDESHGHNVPAGAQSHFKVVLVSQAFSDMRAVKRHQSLYATLDAELQGSVHALALHLYTPEEWHEKGGAPESPACLGGGKK